MIYGLEGRDRKSSETRSQTKYANRFCQRGKEFGFYFNVIESYRDILSK